MNYEIKLKEISDTEVFESLDLHELWLKTDRQEGARAVFWGKKFPKHMQFIGFNLREAIFEMSDLNGATFFGAKLDRVTFCGASLVNANLSNASLNETDFRSADLSGANLEFAIISEADFGNARFEKTNLKNLTIQKSNFICARVCDSSFDNSKLRSVNFGSADLSKASFVGAKFQEVSFKETILVGADFRHTDFGNANLKYALLTDANLRKTRNLRFDDTLIRNAHFNIVSSRFWAVIRNQVFPWLSNKFEKLHWNRLSNYTSIKSESNDPWSILRQTYAGPKMFFLLIFLIAFALPYVGRAAWWGTISKVEPRLIAAAQNELSQSRAELSKLNETLEILTNSQKEQEKIFRELGKTIGPQFLIANDLACLKALRESLAIEAKLKEAIADLENKISKAEERLKNGLTERSVLSVMLHLDRGYGSAILAGILVLYNGGVYFLIARVGALRDEEERSGYSPAWDDYKKLIWIHRVATGLYYVSLVSFIWNAVELMQASVFLPNAS